jgi:hypothetical protein
MSSDCTIWRRGWDSNPEPPLNARKLLIFCSAPIATSATTARVGYSFGTVLSQAVQKLLKCMGEQYPRDPWGYI